MIDSQTSQPATGKKLFYGLFVFPLLIAVGMAILLCSVVLMTREVETPETLITEIKTGSPSKRWQKAFELSNELNRDPAMLRSHAVMNEVIHILSDRREYDARTRAYMAIALSRFEGEEASLALVRNLAEEEDPEVLLYLIWGLGQREYKPAAEAVAGFLKSDDEDLKKTAAYVLGTLGGEEHLAGLTALLEDPSRDVRWNAALSLARLGSAEGLPVLLQMLDRKTLSENENMPAGKVEEVMINAVRGAALLQHKQALPILERLAAEDESLKVRQAAHEAIDIYKGKRNQ